MANRKFHTKIDPTDISIQSEDGGGIQFNKQGKFIFGSKQQNVIDQLEQENYDGNVDINPNDQSYIAIMNQESTNVDVNIANTNLYSLYTPSNNIVNTIDNNNLPQQSLPSEETKTIPIKGIIIGDSQTPLIKNNSKKLEPITSEGVLWKVGWSLSNLLSAIKKYPKDDTITHVFINIGTNSIYNNNDRIEELITVTKRTFPNATVYAIKGSWGWGNVSNLNETDPKIINYYKKFSDNGVTVLTNAIGFSSTHPTPSTPGIIEVAKEIDNILLQQSPVQQSIEEKSQPIETEEIPLDEEGIYEANFLPASEDVEIVQVGETIDIIEYSYDESTNIYKEVKVINQPIYIDKIVSVKGFDQNNIKTAFNFFVNKGYTKEQSAGIVGALIGESEGLKTNAVNKSSTGALGTAQWLGGRLINFLKYMKLPPDYGVIIIGRDKVETQRLTLINRLNYIKNNPEFINGVTLNNLTKQLEFINIELNTNESNAKKFVKTATTPAEAAALFESQYERPAYNRTYYNKIQGYANDVYNKYGK